MKKYGGLSKKSRAICCFCVFPSGTIIAQLELVSPRDVRERSVLKVAPISISYILDFGVGLRCDKGCGKMLISNEINMDKKNKKAREGKKNLLNEGISEISGAIFGNKKEETIRGFESELSIVEATEELIVVDEKLDGDLENEYSNR